MATSSTKLATDINCNADKRRSPSGPSSPSALDVIRYESNNSVSPRFGRSAGKSDEFLSDVRRNRDVNIPGYTGHVRETAEPHPLKSPIRKMKITGYSGHITGSQYIHGQKIIPSQEEQLSKSTNKSTNYGDYYVRVAVRPEEKEDRDIQEIYLNALEKLWRMGQTPQMLLRMLQGKVSERTSSYADQLVQVRKLFEAFDYEGTGSLNIHGFRKCLEYICCSFNEVQSLALFAYFDEDGSKTIDWQELAAHVMVHNPKSGKLVPKSITATMFNEDWNSLSSKIVNL